ncbi:gag-protease polyprotein [Cucumis melo var. makuwa]|uniref:Gag-protease polyprotein n=1 Tax=Cucumis melo var. makuwa TaxID=1194695 RepID=A0A5A7V0Q6_CUCMM|nr:gag-protease polyprotein [Cucumis melo var. makuwa]TYK22126.1 gag-protease polyprotein [Cucumis melo var. makuwa]
MKQRYHNMLRDALAPFHVTKQTPTAPPPASVESQPVPDQLSTKAKHLRDFRKYNLKMFDRSMDNPTKAQMWLTSTETIFRYMKCLNDQKFKESFHDKLFSANLRYVKQQEFLNLEQGDMTVEQYEVEFDMLSRFASNVVRDETAKTEKFVRVDMSLHEKANLSKTAGRGSTPGEKRKAELQPTIVHVTIIVSKLKLSYEEIAFKEA